MGKQIEYSNGELTIVWQPELCRHAGICVKTLPNVYHPKSPVPSTPSATPIKPVLMSEQ